VGVGLGPLITTLVKVVGVKLGSPDVRVYLKIRLFPLFCLES
jgi:hypothetical protein